jgi:glycosyltransferase involved in cell wall biosynthesis
MEQSILNHSNPVVSIVIPAIDLNVINAVSSIFHAKQVTSFEIIVVFNNCNEKIVEGFKIFINKNNNPCKVFYSKNNTIGGARNIGIAAARGKYIIHMDSDCKMLPDYMEQLLPFLGHEFQIIRGKMLFIGKDTFLGRADYKLRQATYRIRKGTCYTPNLIVNEKIHHQKNFIFNDKILNGEDLDFSIQLENNGIIPVYAPNIIMAHKDKINMLFIIKKYFQYGTARAYRFKKWKKQNSASNFYIRIFGEIPSLSIFSLRLKIGIVILYIIRDIGVAYGLLI